MTLFGAVYWKSMPVCSQSSLAQGEWHGCLRPCVLTSGDRQYWPYFLCVALEKGLVVLWIYIPKSIHVQLTGPTIRVSGKACPYVLPEMSRDQCNGRKFISANTTALAWSVGTPRVSICMSTSQVPRS
jgi:hypothetical protein